MVNALSVIESRQEQIDALYHRIFGASESRQTASKAADVPSFRSTEPDEVIIARLSPPSDDLFATGAFQKYPEYPSHSEARLALLNALAFCVGPDADRIDQVYRLSALYDTDHEQKWDRLGEHEIDLALKGRTEHSYHSGVLLNGYHRNGSSGQEGVPADEDGENMPDPPFVPGQLASDVVPQNIDWIRPGWIALRANTVLQGAPQRGKSAYWCDLVAHVTTGKPWPDGAAGFGPADVLVLFGEDTLPHIIVPRLIAAGADLTRVRCLSIMNRDKQGHRRILSLPDDFSVVHAAIQSMRNLKLVVFDPLDAFLTDKLDTHRNHPVRRMIAQLDDFAQQCTLAVVYVRHLNKQTTNTDPLSRGMGSVAWGAAARSVITFGVHPQNPALRVIVNDKSNWSRDTPKSQVFAFEDVNVGLDQHGKELHAPRIRWTGDEIDIDGHELLASELKPSTKIGTAITVLVRLLRERWQLASAVIAHARTEHVNENALTRARKDLEMKSQLVKHKDVQGWIWYLPGTVTPDWNPQDDPAVHEELRRWKRIEARVS